MKEHVVKALKEGARAHKAKFLQKAESSQWQADQQLTDRQLNAVFKGVGVGRTGGEGEDDERSKSAKERWNVAARAARDVALRKTRLEEDVTMPSQADVDHTASSLKFGLRAIQANDIAKRIHNEALLALGLAAESDEEEVPHQGRGVAAFFRRLQGRSSSHTLLSDDEAVSVRQRKHKNKTIEAMLERNALELERRRGEEAAPERRMSSGVARGRKHASTTDLEVLIAHMNMGLESAEDEPVSPGVASGADEGHRASLKDRSATAPSALGSSADASSPALAGPGAELMYVEAVVRLCKPEASEAVGLTLAGRPAAGGRPAAVLVARVAPGSLAEAAPSSIATRLQPYDEVTHVNGTPVSDHAAASALVRAAVGDVYIATRRAVRVPQR